MQFLLESLTDLDASLRARGSRLFILQGNPVDVLPQAFKQWNISKLCFEYDTEPYANVRDTQIKRLAQLHNISVHSPISHTLYDLAEITRRAGNKAPLTMKAFEKIVDGMGAPPPPTAETQMIEAAGFRGVDYENLTLGVVAIHSGFKL